MKKKLLIYFMILVFTSTTLAGIFIIQSAKILFRSETDQKLISIASLIRLDIENLSKNSLETNYDTIASQYSSNLTKMNSFSKEILIMIVDFNGTIKGISNSDPSVLADYDQKNEIILKAKELPNNNEITTQNYISKEFLTVSIPIQQQKLIIQISAPSTVLDNFHSTINYSFMIGLTIALLISIFLALKFSYDISQPIESLARFSGKVKENSSYNSDYYVSDSSNTNKTDGLNTLVDNFNDISKTLYSTISSLENKNATLNSILFGMSAGVIVIDNDSKVVLLNKVANEILELDTSKDYINQNIIEIIRNRTVSTTISKVFSTKHKSSLQINLGLSLDKMVKIDIIPIKISDDEHLGVMIYMEDITEIKKLEQIRTDFVSNVTHELKTPLTSIKGFVETLKNGAIDDKDVSKKFLDIIDIEAERLYMLIDDVLELSEIESSLDDNEIEDISCDVAKALNEAIVVVSGVANKKSIKIHTNIEERLSIKADKHRIKQLFLNLIDNAIKYNNENGEIYVDGYMENEKVIIKVRDTGIGISEEHLPRIFERFYRVDKSRTRDTGGTGLGLSIVKHIINLYNGDLSVKSEVGKGTEFTITL